MMTFSEKLAHLSLSRGKSVRSVALEVGFDPSAAAQWKKRGGKPRPEIAKRLADYFSVPVDDLLDDAREIRPPMRAQARESLQVREDIGYRAPRVIATDPSFSTGARQSSPLPAQLASISAELAALSARLYSGEPPDNLSARLRATGELLHRLADQH